MLLDELNPHRIIAQRHGKSLGVVLYKSRGEPDDEWTEYTVWMVSANGELHEPIVEMYLTYAVLEYQRALERTD